jgi:tyrosine-protein kinase Etk/Wzc
VSEIVDNEPYYDAAPEFYDDGMNLGEVLGTAIENRWQILGITLSVFLLGIVYLFFAAPVYRADALLQVEDKKSGIGTLDVNAIFEGDTSINAEIEILRSRLVLGSVVDKLKLDISAKPNLFPIIGEALAQLAYVNERNAIRVDVLDVPEYLIGQSLNLIADSGDKYHVVSQDGETLLSGKVGEAANASYYGEPLLVFVSELRAEPGDSFQIRKYSRLGSIGELANSLSIREKGRGSSGILEISLEDTDPESASQKVNAIAEAYVDQNKDRKTKEAENSLNFLDKQLPTVKQEMETAEVALNSYRLGKGSIDLPLETQAILETIVAAEGQRNKLRQERDNTGASDGDRAG